MITFDISRIGHVYSGKANKCCCGCAGKYTYASSQSRVAAHRCETVNDRTVKMICNKIMTADDAKEADGLFGKMWTATVDGRWYTAFEIETTPNPFNDGTGYWYEIATDAADLLFHVRGDDDAIIYTSVRRYADRAAAVKAACAVIAEYRSA
jgi:hypothetical protein